MRVEQLELPNKHLRKQIVGYKGYCMQKVLLESSPAGASGRTTTSYCYNPAPGSGAIETATLEAGLIVVATTFSHG